MHSRKKRTGKEDVCEETSEIYDYTVVNTWDQLLHLKLENFLHWSWTLGTFNSLILRLDWKYLELTLPAKETRPDGISKRQSGQ